MPTGKPTQIPIPVSTFPGGNPQESAGRLINCTAEPLGEAQHPSAPAAQVWRRQPGLSQHNLIPTGQAGYRGGLIVVNLSYEAWSGNASTLDTLGNYVSLGAFPGTKKVSIARNQAATPDVVAVDIDNGAYILATSALASASGTATVSGSTLTAGDTISLTFFNIGIAGLPVTVTYTLGAGETTTTIATALKNAINLNNALIAAAITATSGAAVITISQPGAIGNSTTVSFLTTGVGNEKITFSPVSGTLAGGTGTPGITFAGTPLAYNGIGAMPQPNSVAFQDGYFFFTIGNGQCFASNQNSLQINALTQISVVSHADVQLLRAIAFSGLLWLFTTGSCEIWQDTAAPFPGFPYTRQVVIEYGLIQANAIAGWETGFSELCWVAQDFGVYWATPGTTTPIKISPPDLDRLIETEIRLGNTLEASCYTFSGKKFWVLSSPDWSWEFNLSTRKWNERWSLVPALGLFGRWRATGGHPAFGKWLMGDVQSGNLLWIDNTNFTENGAVQIFRIETGPVRDFPNQIRIARADFDFDMGVGIVVANVKMTVTGAAAGTGGVIRLAVNDTAQTRNNDTCNVSGVGGTTEANGTFLINVIDATHIELQGTVFVHAWTSGGIAVDVTSPPNAINPMCAISLSKDGGVTFDNPSVRAIGQQGKTKRSRASVKNRGLSGPQGCRWRIDVTDPVYTSLLGATQSSDPRDIGA